MPFILLAISLLFTLRGNYYTAPPQKGGFSGPLSCQPNLETNQIIHVDIAPEKEYLSNGSPLYLDKEGKEWALIKRQAPIPAWKVWGGMIKTREGLRLGEMEEIGKTTPPAAFNPDALGKRVFIGLGHCDGTPGETCIDPIVQDTVFVAIKETYQSWNEIPPQARPKCEQTDPITKKCSKMSWGDPEFEGYWWEFNIYLDKSLLPDPATNDDLPCWTRIACAGDIIVDGGKRRKAMMDEYLKSCAAGACVCPVGTDPKTSTAKALSFDSLGSGEFQTAASPPTPTPTATVIAPQGGKSLKLGTFYPSSGFNYEWWTPACKPAIYLYPEKPTELIVKVKPQGKITESIPKHGEDGWRVIAYPDGRLREYESHESHETYETYGYLYYEAKLEKVKVPKEGWLVEKENLKSFFKEILPQLGLNEKEEKDFLSYWLPKLSEGEKWFIGLIEREELDRVEPIEFSSPGTPPHRRAGSYQQPDTFIRVRFYFEKIDEHQKAPQSGDLVHPASLLIDWILNLENNITYNKTFVKYLNFQGVDPSGVEPDGHGLRIQSSQPAEPTPIFIPTNLSAPVNEENIAISQYRNIKPRRGFVVVDWGGILANGSCGLNEKSE